MSFERPSSVGVSGRTLALLASQLLILALLLLVALDIYAHKRVEGLGGVNIWGYRGPVIRQRQPNEIRVAIVGGTRAFSFGQPASGTIAVELRRLILLATDRPGEPLRPVVAANLARYGASADTYQRTIERYAHLRPDYICIYDDLGIPPTSAVPLSGVFEWTGYEPALPLVLREKGMLWRYGDVKLGYITAPSDDVRPFWVRRVAGTAIETFGTAAGAVDRALAGAASRSQDGTSATARPATYARTILDALGAAHQHARGVILVVSPAESDEQLANLRLLESELTPRLAERPWLRFVNLGDAHGLRDPALRVDGWSYGAAGIGLAATEIAPAVVELIQQR